MPEPSPTRKKVYVETTVVSDATALPSRDVVQLGRQVATQEWWATAARRFDLYCSDVVKREAMRGNPEAADRRLEALRDIPEIQTTRPALALAEKLTESKAIPREYPDDALHVALAAICGMDYLVSWNFKHITNAQTVPLIKRICAESGFPCPEICTPYQLQAERDVP